MHNKNNILGIVFKHKDYINNNNSNDEITIEYKNGKSGGSYIYNGEEKFCSWSIEEMVKYLNEGTWIAIKRKTLNYEIY